MTNKLTAAQALAEKIKGAPLTSPEIANLWCGYAMSVDRMEFERINLAVSAALGVDIREVIDKRAAAEDPIRPAEAIMDEIREV
jgi:hypothetical protein